MIDSMQMQDAAAAGIARYLEWKQAFLANWQNALSGVQEHAPANATVAKHHDQPFTIHHSP